MRLMRQPHFLLTVLIGTCSLVACNGSKTEPGNMPDNTNAEAPATHLAAGFDLNDAANRQQLAKVVEKSQLIDTGEIDAELARIRQDMLIDRYLQAVYNDAVDESEVQRYYRENLADFQIERVKLAHVFFRIAADASEEVKQSINTQAREVMAKLRMGESFEELVKTYSEDERTANNGGELGWVNVGDIDEQVMNTALLLNANEVSEPIQTSYGIHIIRKLSDSEQTQKPLSQVRAAIRLSLRTQARENALQQLVLVE